MRRRDATDHSLLYSVCRIDRRTLVSFTVALAVHATLLATLSVRVVHIAAPAPLIVVSLVANGGSAGPPQPAAAPLPQPGVGSTRPPAPTKATRTRRERVRNPVAAAVALAPTPGANAPSVSAEDASGSVARAASSGARGNGAGNGWGGIGGGTGTGTGSGSGDGTGSGDQRTRCIVCPEPSYPLVARRHGWQGTVEVAVSLLADGSVANAAVRRSCGYEILDREALAVARRSRFTPLGAGPSRGHIAYRFELIAPRP
jgi:TonB family protein